MALASIAEYIDFLTDRFGADTATTRSRCLSWLQWAESELWSSREWWFRQKTQSVATTDGTKTYSLGQVSTKIYQVVVDGGAPLSYLPPTLFAELCSSATAGVPVYWTQAPAGNTSGYPEFSVWPVPEDAGTALVTYLAGPSGALSDAGDSVSGFPAHHRMVVLYKALLRGLDHHNLGSALQLAKGEYEQYLGALLAEDEQQVKVSRL